MIVHTQYVSTVTDRATRIMFALSCLQEGVRRGRAQATADRVNRQHTANLAARWQG